MEILKEELAEDLYAPFAEQAPMNMCISLQEGEKGKAKMFDALGRRINPATPAKPSKLSPGTPDAHNRNNDDFQ